MKTIAVLMFSAVLTTSCGSSDAVESVGADPTPPEDPLDSGPSPVSTLDIVVTHPDTDDVVYTISCLDDTATVAGNTPVSAEQACTALANDEVRTRIVDGAPAARMCTEIYGGPDLATIVGDLDGAAVDTTVDRSNGCGIDDWDRLLADVLPPAVGAVEPVPRSLTRPASDE